MNTLNTKLSDLYAYVTKEIVWDINTTDNTKEDPCCVPMSEENTEAKTVVYLDKKGKEVEVVYYFDTYVKDGDSLIDQFVPNQDHILDFSGASYDSYESIHRDEAIIEIVDKMLAGQTFDAALSKLPLYYRYGAGDTITGSTTYASVVSSDFEPITKDDERLIDYVIVKAKKNGVECVNTVLSVLGDEEILIDEDDIKIGEDEEILIDEDDNKNPPLEEDPNA